MTGQAAAAALMEAWSACGYDPALAALHFPRYAFRELCPRKLPDGAVELTVAKRGFYAFASFTASLFVLPAVLTVPLI